MPLWYWYKKEIDLGQFVLLQTLVATLVSNYDFLSSTFLNFFRMYGNIKDGLELISQSYEIKDIVDAKPINFKKANIKFSHLYYHYKNSNALFADFNLEIKAGEKVGLVGQSGAGKSTLINLLARARAILKNAPILILDEATSALDSESEKHIQASLKSLMKNKTVIVIAHRLSTLQEMDRLVVMEKGQIIEEGTHQSLLAKSGRYARFYHLQSEGFLKI